MPRGSTREPTYVDRCYARHNFDTQRLCVTGHRRYTLDKPCGATITNSSVSSALLPLRKRVEEGKQLETVY